MIIDSEDARFQTIDFGDGCWQGSLCTICGAMVFSPAIDWHLDWHRTLSNRSPDPKRGGRCERCGHFNRSSFGDPYCVDDRELLRSCDCTDDD